ncbi:purine-cytosine permease family protein [Streptomyces sp. NPDC059169]|uniref:purine-cytosine permease family protein n=1 Tax=Streptomyces sp. NPDC059169 TaxID=3346754 RepID=UPI0036C42FCD
MVQQANQRAELDISFVDDPRVVKEAATEDYSTHVVPRSWRSGRLSLSMAWAALCSAMFWLVVAASVALAVGTSAALVGVGLSLVTYGGVNYVLSRYASRTGLTVALMSRRLFGYLGAVLAPLIFAATAVYYAVFEGSVVAVAFHQYFGGMDIRLWYLAVVLYSIPLVFGGVLAWLDKLNGFLLPFYVVGLVAAVVWAGTKFGFSGHWLHLAATTDSAPAGVPGWVFAYTTYMGVWIMMLYTIDFARFGKEADAGFHGVVTFGPVFYLVTFLGNGLAGIFLASTVPTRGGLSEVSVVYAIVGLMGLAGLALIWVSQTRINTANFYLASTNLDACFSRLFGIKLHRTVWTAVVGGLVYLIMLTDVLSYILQALRWQGVFVVAWVGIALTHITLVGDDRDGLPEFRPGRLRLVAPGAVVWLLASGVGIYLTERGSAVGAVWASPVTLVLAVVGYAVAVNLLPSPVLTRGHDPRDEVHDIWEARIRCHVCDRYYVAVEMDRDPSASHAAICSGCASQSTLFYHAARAEAVQRTSQPTPLESA